MEFANSNNLAGRKSQIALELGYHYRTTHPKKSVFWIRADTSWTFERSVRSLAEVLQLQGRRDPEANIFELVHNWLSYEARDGWLMIVDNVDDEEALEREPKSHVSQANDSVGISASPLSALLPQNPEGHILITSRSKSVAFNLTGNQETVIEVGLMSVGESIDLFRKAYKGEWDQNDAYQLTKTLGFLPLAISQAAAYLNQRAPRLTARTYLAEFQKNQEELLKRDTAGSMTHGKTLQTTWQTSFKQITPSARRLLSFMCLCWPDAIPDYLARSFQDGAKIEPERTVDLNFEDAISTLTNYSLIKTDSTGHSFSVHRLVQHEMRRYLELTAELEEWKSQYIVILSTVYPEDLYKEWAKCEQLSPHMDTASAYRPADEHLLHYWTNCVNHAAEYAEATGNYDRAEQLHLRALEEVEKAFGAKHPTTLASANKLGSIYLHKGKFDEAEAMIRRALEGRQELLGQENLDTTASYNTLAMLLHERGNYVVATEVSRQTLAKREKTLGSKHPDTLVSIQNLALVLADQGNLEEAEEMSLRALQGNAEVLGEEHPHTLLSINNLASIYLLQGRLMEAEERTRSALAGYERVLGSEHPSTLVSMGNLATLLTKQGNFQEAEEMSRRTLRKQEMALAPEHPDALASMDKLVIISRYQGKLEEAVQIGRRALQGRQKVLGPDHPDTLASMNKLVIILRDQGKLEEAEHFGRQALQGLEKAPGSDHSRIIARRGLLEDVLRDQSKHEASSEIT